MSQNQQCPLSTRTGAQPCYNRYKSPLSQSFTGEKHQLNNHQDHFSTHSGAKPFSVSPLLTYAVKLGYPLSQAQTALQRLGDTAGINELLAVLISMRASERSGARDTHTGTKPSNSQSLPSGTHTGSKPSPVGSSYLELSHTSKQKTCRPSNKQRARLRTAREEAACVMQSVR